MSVVGRPGLGNRLPLRNRADLYGVKRPMHNALMRSLLPALLVLALIGCSGGSPAASPTTGVDPSPGTTPDATTSPSPTATPGPTPTAEGLIGHSTSPTDVLLRMERSGGFVPVGVSVTDVPEFTLHGDGTFIVRSLDLAPDWTSGLSPLLQGKLDEQAVQSLLETALGPGRLAGARERYEDNTTVDAPDTIFTINTDPVTKRVTIQALMEALDPQPGPDTADRAGFAQLAELLRSFAERAQSGELGEVTNYEPAQYRVFLLESFGELPTEPIEWPWDSLTPDDFRQEQEFGWPEAVLSSEDVSLIVEVPSGGHLGVAVERDGETWLVAVRPLLPDEVPAD
jgi:hypothetical protein